MSSIMRGDQTVSLIQQYHAHYPDIARNTQDVEGRKQRVHMWAKITEELNAQYNTNFTVEQFKKKVQNVQCTSRQKIQSGKRNLGDAEMEYMRLFEQDRLNNATFAANGNCDDYTLSRTPIGSFTTEDVNTHSVFGKLKFFELPLSDKSDFLNANETDEINEDDEDHSTPSTSEAISGFGTPATPNTGTLNVLFGVNNNSSVGAKPNLNGSLEQAQQLLLAMMANNFPALVEPSAAVATGNASAKTVEPPMLPMKGAASTPTALCRKRANSNNVTSTGITDNNCSDNNNNNSGNNNNGQPTAASINDGHAPIKRRRKQPHAVHLSHLRPAEALLSFGSTFDEVPTFCTGPAAVPKGVAESRPVSVGSATAGLSLDADHRWRSDVVEMQKAILDNQRRILEIIEKQTMMLEERESRRSNVSSSLSAGSSRSDPQLDALCGKIDVLAMVLSSIDMTLKSFMTSKAAGAEKSLRTDDSDFAEFEPVPAAAELSTSNEGQTNSFVKQEQRRSMECYF